MSVREETGNICQIALLFIEPIESTAVSGIWSALFKINEEEEVEEEQLPTDVEQHKE